MIVIIDYKTGNLGSIVNILRHIGVKSLVSSDPEVIGEARGLILPGVGAFDSGISNLREQNLIHVLNRKVITEGVPFLGICLGMQLMASSSEEGSLPGLNWISGTVRRFSFADSAKYKVPHMGWNFVEPERTSSLLAGLDPGSRFYFVHSFHFTPADSNHILATTEYETRFVSAVGHDNIMGVQFHPEKSHKFGMKLLQNFAALC